MPFVVSTPSSVRLEEIARAAPDTRLWFQLYVYRDREVARSLVRRARDAGFEGIMITADSPVFGQRERDARHRFGVPVKLTPRMFWDAMRCPRWTLGILRHGVPRLQNFVDAEKGLESIDSLAAHVTRNMDASVTWRDVAGLCEGWRGKVMLLRGRMTLSPSSRPRLPARARRPRRGLRGGSSRRVPEVGTEAPGIGELEEDRRGRIHPERFDRLRQEVLLCLHDTCLLWLLRPVWDCTPWAITRALCRFVLARSMAPLESGPLVRLISFLLGRGLVLLALLVSIALALAFRLGDASTWWIELLRYAPYPAWLGPVALVFALSWALPWRWRAMAGAALGLVLGPVMGLSLGLGRTEGLAAGAALPLRVMTYNIKSYRAEWREDGYEGIVDEIRRHAPDLLVMQDAPHLNRPERMRRNAVMRDVLAGYRWFGHGQFVVASRYPLRDCTVAQLPIDGDDDPRDYLRCTVLVGNRPVSVVDVHTLTPREGLNATRHQRLGGLAEWRENFAARMGQAQRLAADVAKLPRPLIVAGDLNASQASPVVQVLLAAGLRDAFGEAGRGWGYTVGHALRPHLSLLRIDHVLVSREIGVVAAEAGGRWGSEHRPVVADVLVPQ